MGFLDTFETSILFRFARLLTLMLVAGGILSTLVGIVLYDPLSFGNSVQVSADDVRAELKGHPESAAPIQPTSDPSDDAISGAVNRFLDAFDPAQYDRGQLQSEVISWVQRLPQPQQRVEFIQDMTRVVEQFPQNERGGAAYAFARLRFQKEQERLVNSVKDAATKEQGKLLVASGLGLVGLFSLVLVLLRIERNTRPQQV
jgi:hypothetical protein